MAVLTRTTALGTSRTLSPRKTKHPECGTMNGVRAGGKQQPCGTARKGRGGEKPCRIRESRSPQHPNVQAPAATAATPHPQIQRQQNQIIISTSPHAPAEHPRPVAGAQSKRCSRRWAPAGFGAWWQTAAETGAPRRCCHQALAVRRRCLCDSALVHWHHPWSLWTTAARERRPWWRRNGKAWGRWLVSPKTLGRTDQAGPSPSSLRTAVPVFFVPFRST